MKNNLISESCRLIPITFSKSWALPFFSFAAPAFSFVAAYSDRVGDRIKGHEHVLLKGGELLREAMKKSSLSCQEVMQSLRQNAQTEDISKVKTATLERSGEISVILKEVKK